MKINKIFDTLFDLGYSKEDILNGAKDFFRLKLLPKVSMNAIDLNSFKYELDFYMYYKNE